MSLVDFKMGTPEDLAFEPYHDGSLYFIFPDGSNTGHIYLDTDGVRKAISAAYNDTPIIDRILELERLTLVHSTGVSLSTNNMIISVGGSGSLTATATPANVTDLFHWTSSDDSVCEIASTTTNGNTSTAILAGIDDGTSVITVTCGEYSATCLVEAQSGHLVEYTLLENWTGDGSSFVYTAPISLDHGQYIEVSLSVAGITQIKQNIISFGQNISSTGKAFNIHCYTSATVDKIQRNLRMYWTTTTTNQSNIEVATGNTIGNIKIKLDNAGLWINDSFYTPAAAYTTIFESIMTAFRGFSSFQVGSAEGTTRSTAHYNYIKYYAYEES